jgi:hypothetical protein
MIETFVEKNRKLLLFYYWAARIGGWIFLSYVCLVIAGNTFALAPRIGDWNEFVRYYHNDVPWKAFSNILPTGLLVLGISQLIWYLFESSHKAGWILRNGDKLLYTYTAILICYYCLACIHDVATHFNEPYDFPLRLVLELLYIAVKILALVGLAQLLKRLLPMIEESRTLV